MATAHNIDTPTHINTILREWARQILALAPVIEAVGGDQIEVRLFANRGKVRKAPIITLNAGPQEMVNMERE